MLVSHNHRFIFLKTRKTASTSVENYFVPYCIGPDEPIPNIRTDYYESEYGIVGKRGNKLKSKNRLNFKEDFPFISFSFRRESVKWYNHMSAHRLSQKLDPLVWRDYFKFSTVRNPFTKVISGYFFKKRKRGIPILTPEKEKKAFNRWIKTGKARSDRSIYLIRGKSVLDDVIKVENMDSDMSRICNIIGIPWQNNKLGKKKSGIRPDWASIKFLYTDETRKLVEDQFAFELATFNYKFPD